MQPNYPLFRGIEITAVALAIIFVVLRLINRWQKKNLSFDDAILVFAAAFDVVITVLVLRLYEYGYGKLEDDILPEWKIPIGQLSMAIFTTFPLCYSLIRSSIVLTYLRLFPAQTNKWFCYALFAAQAVYALWAGLTTLLQCKPIKGYWLADIDKTCRDPQNQDIAILVLNSTFDIITYTWPAHYLYKLNLPVKSRIGLIALFSVGVVNIGIGFTRLSLLLAMYTTKQWTKYGIWGCMCIVLEANIGIMCACLPYLKFIYDYATHNIIARITNSFGSRSRTRTRTRTKAKSSDPNHEHPFHELNGGGIQRKTDITISGSEEDDSEDRPAGVPAGYVRTTVVRNDIRRMEKDFERRRADENKKSGESVLLAEAV